MKVTPQGVGRLEDSRYYALKIAGVDAAFAPTATYLCDGHTMPCPLWCVDGAGTDTQLWVLAFPFLPSDHQGLDVFDADGTTLWTKRFSPRGLNLNNSVTCRVKPKLTALMQGIELRHADDSAFIDALSTQPYDDESEVTRIDVIFPEGVRDVTLDPLQVLVNVTPLDAQVLRCGLGDDLRHHVILSYRLRKDEGDLLFATPAGPGYGAWIFHMTPALRSGLVHGFADMVLDAAGDPRYAEWFLAQRAGEDELARQRTHHFDNEPLVSVVVPIYEPPLAYLRECLGSVMAQSYANWELVAVNGSPDNAFVNELLLAFSQQDPRIHVLTLEENRGIVGNTNAGIAASRGDYVALLDQDDLLEPDALFEYVRTINDQPEAGLIYCDEDSFTEGLDSVFYPRLKPDYNPDALHAHNYVIHMLVARRDVLDQVGPYSTDVEGAQDYDLTLRMSEVAPVAHVPRILYHWRKHEQSINWDANEAKPYVTNAAIASLQAHFARTGVRANVASGMRPGTHVVSYEVTGEPLVSVIIPTKDHPELLGPCVDSLLEKAGWDRLEVLLVENNSCDPATFAFYDELLARDPRIRLLRYDGPFNYSKIINFAVREARGDYLYLLNNDTVTLTDGLIRTLVAHAQQPGVGVVGPLLLFPDGIVQTAGLALMADGRLGFMNQGLTLATHGGYLASLECPRDYSAVLGAAQMVSKALFDEVGGYDEELAITYNDVDFCWRVRETGHRVAYTPLAQMTHREFATRGRDSVDPARAAQTIREAERMRARWPEFFANGDPELNPGCDPASPWFKLPQM